MALTPASRVLYIKRQPCIQPALCPTSEKGDLSKLSLPCFVQHTLRHQAQSHNSASQIALLTCADNPLHSPWVQDESTNEQNKPKSHVPPRGRPTSISATSGGGIASRLRQLFPRWVSIYSILGFSRPLHRLDRFFCWFWVPAPTRHLGETWRRHFDDFSTVWTIILASCRWAATTARTLCLDQFMFPASNTQSFPP